MTPPSATASAPPFTTAQVPFTGSASATPFPRPRTFEDRFCGHHQCNAATFRRFVLNYCVPSHLRLLASVMLKCRGSYFACEHRLIDEIAKARCVDDVQLDAHDYRQDPVNRRLMRRLLGLRMSTSRLIGLARNYLPQRYGSLQSR